MSPTGDREEPEVPDRVARRTDLRLLLPAVLAWVSAATLLGRPVALLLSVLGALVLLVVLAVLVARRRRQGALAAVCAVATLLAVGALAAWTVVRETGPVRELATERATVSVDGHLTTDPHAVTSGGGMRGGQPLVIASFVAESVTSRGVTTRVQSPLLVLGDSDLLDLGWHDHVRFVGRLGPTDDPADDSVAVLTPRGEPTILGSSGPFAEAAGTVRHRFRAAAAHLPADARGLMPALVIGDTTETPADLTAAMQATGMTHLSAVSGSNVSFVLAAGLGLCGAVGVRRRWRPLVALAVLLGFVVLVRPEPSVVRAAAMGTVGLLGLSVSRARDGLPALSAAVLGLLVWDPWLARSFGFALSTLATLGLLLFARPWGTAIAARLPSRVRAVGPALAIPVAAQIMCGPVIVLLQGSVSVVGIVTNLLAAPLVAPATVLGVVVALVSVVWTAGAAWLAWLPALPTLGIAWIARAGAEMPWGAVPWPADARGALLLAGVSVGLVVTGPWLLHQARRRPVAAVGCGVIALAATVPTAPVVWPPAGWRFVMCDVGQGDGLVLRSSAGTVVVVDTGPDPGLMDACLSRLDLHRIDAVVLTHDHADHVDGLPGVIEGRTVGRILTDPVDDPPQQAGDLAREAAAAGVPTTDLYAGDRLTWPGITARVWWPARVIRAGSVPNNASIVLTVDVDGLRLALLGDIEREAAREVLAELRADPAALAGGMDVLKVAHHGSSNRDDDLYHAIDAPLALISVGVDNDYGHPAPATLAALARAGADVRRTDLSGDIAVLGTHGDVRVATSR